MSPYTAGMEVEAIRRWVENHRAAQRRELEEIDRSASLSRSIAAALSLIALAGKRHGWPVPPDPVEEREDERVRRVWERLRERMAVVER